MSAASESGTKKKNKEGIEENKGGDESEDHLAAIPASLARIGRFKGAGESSTNSAAFTGSAWAFGVPLGPTSYQRDVIRVASVSGMKTMVVVASSVRLPSPGKRQGVVASRLGSSAVTVNTGCKRRAVVETDPRIISPPSLASGRTR